MPSKLDLSSLPKPEVIEELSFADLFNELVADFKTLKPDYELLLESDPVYMVIKLAAYREYLIRQRANEAARATLLAFSGDGNLDHLGAFHGVSRLVVTPENEDTGEPAVLETDVDFRLRIQEEIAGSSVAGPDSRYIALALSADGRVKAATVDNPEDNIVNVYILSKENAGIPTSEVLEAVQAVIGAKGKRVLTDNVTALAAVNEDVDVDVTVQLLEDAPEEVFDNLEDTFNDAFDSDMTLGRDLTLSWIIDTLHQSGVYKVTVNSPEADVVVPSNKFVKLNSLTISQGARAT